MTPPSAAALRRRMRTERRALTHAEQREHARRAARHFAASRLLLAFDRFAIYSPTDGELDPEPIADRLREAGKIVALPIVGRGPRLTFHRPVRDTRFVRNRFGIAEPDTRTAPSLPVATLDVVLLPLVAFDAAGHRLGMGGGYYDATFASQRRALLIGLAHDGQRCAEVPHRPWDVPLDGIITEREACAFTPRGRRFLPERRT